MLFLLYTALIVVILLVNLSALSVLLARPLRSYVLAKAAGPVILISVFFFVEHFAGFGNLHWVWPVSTAISVWAIYRRWGTVRAHWRWEAAFTAAFLYPLAWRFAFPDINGSSEKISDLSFVCDYLPGAKLPPVDVWFPPYPFTIYYGMQHYASALIGRTMNLDPGLTYNLGFCVIVGVGIFAAGAMAWTVTRRRWAALLVTAAFAVGGTGASLPMRWIKPAFTPWDSMRFIGASASPKQATLPLGQWLVKTARVPEDGGLDLPAETFGYLAQLGDLHPPLSGFVLLALALLAIAMVERGEAETQAAAILGLTVPLTIACDAWNFPLQLMLTGVWLCLRPRHWKSVAAGLGTGMVLMTPFIAYFSKASVGIASAFRIVPWGQHTPWLLGMILLYPFVLLALLSLFNDSDGGVARWVGMFWLYGFVLVEFVFVDDVYVGKYNRFNTALKWWPYFAAGAVLWCGAWGLASRKRWLRMATAVPLLVVAAYAGDLAWSWAATPKLSFGRLDGAAWLQRDPASSAMLEWLRTQPRGVAMELWSAPAFSNSCAIPLFAGHRLLLGWPAHESLWRGERPEVSQREAEIRMFYQGTMPEALRWLKTNEVSFVLWLSAQNDLPAGTWQKIQDSIGAECDWHEFDRAGDARIGLWSRHK